MFTDSGPWLDYIRNDPHKTIEISLESVFIMDKIQEMSWYAIPRIKLPVYVLLAVNDRIVDNSKVQEYLTSLIESSPLNKFSSIKTGHAVQFDQPDELAKRLSEFLESLPVETSRESQD